MAAFQAAVAAEDWDTAVAALDALAAAAPGPGVHYNRAVALRRAGRPADAVAAADAALALAPTHNNAAFERAAALMDAGRVAEAAAAFAGYLDAVPDDADARLNLAALHVHLGGPDAAIAALGPLDSPAALLTRAEALRDLGRLDEAEAALAALPPAAALRVMTHGAFGRLPLDQRRLCSWRPGSRVAAGSGGRPEPRAGAAEHGEDGGAARTS